MRSPFTLRKKSERRVEELRAEVRTLKRENQKLAKQLEPDRKKYPVTGRVAQTWHLEGLKIVCEESWSTDSRLSIRGYVDSENGAKGKLSFEHDGLPPDLIKWTDREDVRGGSGGEQDKGAKRERFWLSFPRRANHQLSVEGDGIPKRGLRLSATGFSQLPLDSQGPGFPDFINRVNQAGGRVLEIGSRIVSPGSSSKRTLFGDHLEFVGFDIYKDDNTDVVGDAHQLSSYFPDGRKFDGIFALSVFEHLAMPWVVAKEISKMLNPGGLVYIATHFAWPVHERPWDFWRFTDEGLRVLFCPGLGFELIQQGFFAPCRIHLESPDLTNVDLPVHPAYGGVSVLAKKANDFDETRYGWPSSISEILPEGSAYPTLAK